MAGCIEEKKSEGLVIEEGTATTKHDEREIILSGRVENEASNERSGTIVGEEVFTESKDITLEGHDSSRFDLNIPVESPNERINYSYLITTKN